MSMSDYLSNVSLIGDLVFNLMTQVFSLYTTHAILGASLGLWVLRRIFKLLNL